MIILRSYKRFLDLRKAFEMIREKDNQAYNPNLKVVNLVHDRVDLLLRGQQVETDSLVVGQ